MYPLKFCDLAAPDSCDFPICQFCDTMLKGMDAVQVYNIGFVTAVKAVLRQQFVYLRQGFGAVIGIRHRPDGAVFAVALQIQDVL